MKLKVSSKCDYDRRHIGKTKVKIKDTGNGYIVKFPAMTSVAQDYYVCLDYEQGGLIYQAFEKLFKEKGR